MKQTFFIIIFALFVVVQISCEEKTVHEGYHGGMHSKNFIACYLDCDSVALNVIDNRIDVVFDGDIINSVHNPQKFDSLAKANNDTEYNDWIVGFNESINDSISSISIKCDKDIDEGHLAGAELNDLFTFKYKSYYTVVQKHYDKYDGDWIQMSAKDVSASIVRVIAVDGCSLTLDTPPAQSGTYTFDVSIQLSKITLKNTVTMEF